ncbi:hypothetical protein Slin14017_G121890 [Septoria linicola]|nr:hypothetical protein Slin14017_G121890 [Septoria linicola]
MILPRNCRTTTGATATTTAIKAPHNKAEIDSASWESMFTRSASTTTSPRSSKVHHHLIARLHALQTYYATLVSARSLLQQRGLAAKEHNWTAHEMAEGVALRALQEVKMKIRALTDTKCHDEDDDCDDGISAGQKEGNDLSLERWAEQCIFAWNSKE